MTFRKYKPIKKGGRELSKNTAVWQYLMDHATPVVGRQGERLFKISFHLRDRKHWNECIHWRVKGIYRNTEEEMEREFRALEYGRWRQEQISAAKAKRADQIINSGTLLERVLLKINKITYEYLFKNEVKLQKEFRQRHRGHRSGQEDTGKSGQIDLRTQDSVGVDEEC